MAGNLNAQRDLNLKGFVLPGVPPERSLCVAKPPTMFGGAVYPSGWFTTIQAAIDAGAAMAPTEDSPVIVTICPGVYTENLTFKSFVYLTVADQPGASDRSRAVKVVGTHAWTPVLNTDEKVIVSGLRITGAGTYDATGKGGGSIATLILNATFFDAACAYSGNAAFASFFVPFFQGASFIATQTLNTAFGIGVGANGAAVVLNSSADLSNFGACTWGNITLATTSTFSMDSGSVGNVTAPAGTSADIRGVGRLGTMTGPGAINRSVINGSTGALAAGAGQVIAFAVPLKDANYNVQLTATAGGAVPPIVTAKVAASFTLTVGVGGGTWDYSAIHS